MFASPSFPPAAQTAGLQYHNTLRGLQGGSSTQYYHLTASEYAGTGSGVFARASGPTFNSQSNTGLIDSTKTQECFRSFTLSTTYTYCQFRTNNNAGGNLAFGVASSTGTGFGSGVDNYASVFGSFNATPVNISCNSVVALKIDTSQKLNPTTGMLPDGGGFKHARVTTGSIAGTTEALITITWGTAFADASYTVAASVIDSTSALASLSIVHVESVSASAVTVRVYNASAGALTGEVQVIAIHD